jgi:SAM-dependent methyltransferase
VTRAGRTGSPSPTAQGRGPDAPAQARFGADRVAVSSVAMEGARNYFRWQYEAIRSHIGERVLEAGCGESGFTEMLLGRRCVVSVDVDATVIENARRKFGAHAEWHGVVGDFTSSEVARALAEHRFDSVAALNVVEHIRDDAGALRVLRSLLPAGGTAAVLVPAHRVLYGTMDEAAGHFKRYSRRELVAAMRAAGFRVDDAFYFNAVGAVGWWVNGRVRKTRQEETVSQVRFFDAVVVPVARRVERRVRPPFGISVIALGTAV